MGGIFSTPEQHIRSKKTRITKHDEVVFKLKVERDNIKKYQKRINANLERERLLAKNLISQGKKDRALILLKKKKYQEGLIVRADGQLDTIETLIHDLEFSQVQKQVFESLKAGNEALKIANEAMSIDEIEQIMDDTAEGIEKAREISAILSNQCELSEADEQEVLEELETLVEISNRTSKVEIAASKDGDVDLSHVPDVPVTTDEEPVIHSNNSNQVTSSRSSDKVSPKTKAPRERVAMLAD